MFLLILYYSIQFTYSLIPNNVTCAPSLDDCKSLLTYFQFQNTVHSYIHLILPFTITQETFTISSADGGAAFPEIVLSGGPYFKVNAAIPNSILMKGYLSLNTVRLADPSTANLNTTGPFQIRVVTSTLDTTLVQQESIKLAFFYKLKNKLFGTTTVTQQSIVIPTTAGTCTITDWSNVIKKNKIRQLNQFIIQLSQDMTNDRLDIQLTLSAVSAGFIFHRECYLSGSDLSKFAQTCIVSQNANVLNFLIRVTGNNSKNIVTLLKGKTSYTIEFFITHSGSTMETQTFTTQVLRDGVALDTASGTKTYLIDTTDEGTESINEVSLYLNTPNIKVPTLFGLMFRPRILEYDTLIKVELGFIQTLDTFNCIVYQIQSDGLLEPTMNFKSYYLNNNDLYFITNNESPYLMNVKYSINCTGMIINPNDGFIRITYQDLYNTIISKAEIAQPLVIPSLDSTNNDLVIIKQINIIKKEFNYPLSSTVISFSIKPTSYVRRVLIEFPYYYSYVSLSCLFNGTITDCIGSDEIKNRIIIYIQTKVYVKINDPFNVTICGMINPSSLPYNAQIYVLLDDDNYMDALIQENTNELNGIIQSERIDDYMDISTYKNTPQTIGIPLQISTTSTSANKISLYWYKVNSNNEYTRLVGTLPHFEINTNYFNENKLFLGHYDYQSRFNITMNLQFPQLDNLIIYGSSSYLSKQSFTNEQLTLNLFQLTSLTDTNNYIKIQDKNMTINPGDSGYWFSICAKDVISGEYNVTLNFSLIYPQKNSWNSQEYVNFYNDIPTISFRVVQQDCQYQVEQTEYILPFNGTTLPIIVDSSNCIPLYDQQLKLDYDNNNKLELVPIQMSLSRKRIEQLKRSSPKQILNKYIFKFATTLESNPGIITQIRISNLLITIKCILHVDSTLIATPLIGTYSDVVNRLTLSLGCSEESEINLLIGIDEVSDSEYLKIPNQIDITLSNDFNIFSIIPQNLSIQNYGYFSHSLKLDETHLISEMYLNDIANNIMYDQNDLIKQINQTSLKNSYSSPLLTLINNIKLSKRNLLERGNQLQLQRYYIRINQKSQFSFPINNLEYNTKYSIGYYCRNLMNNVSNFTQNFIYINNETTQNNQLKGQMLNIIFRKEITQEQKNNILCSISQYYAFNYYQVLGNDCNQCRILNITYNKMNYSTYLQLNQSFIPYENRTPSEQQRYTQQLYKMNIYLNNYISSAGYSTDVNKTIQQKSTINLDLIRNILNITDDLELQYLLDSYGYINLTQNKRGEVEIAKQIVINQFYVKNDKLQIEIKANSPILSIIGLHKLEPLFENDLKHPSGLQLRRGVLGTMDKISEGVLLNQIDSNNNITISFSNLIDNQKYILYWSSTDILNDCLTRQYSNTGYQIITYQQSNQNFSYFQRIMYFILLLIIS